MPDRISQPLTNKMGLSVQGMSIGILIIVMIKSVDKLMKPGLSFQLKVWAFLSVPCNYTHDKNRPT